MKKCSPLIANFHLLIVRRMINLFRNLALFCAIAAPLSAREPTSQDYDVWNALISDYIRLGTAYVWHLVEPTAVFDRGETKGALYFFPEARPVENAWAMPEAELDTHKLRYAANRGMQRFPHPPKVRLLDAATLARIAGGIPKSTWLASPRLLPDAEVIVRLSWPAYREDGRAAFLICAVCTKEWGSVMECKVDKDFLSGKWRLGDTFRRDFTYWKDGKLFVDE